MGRRRFWQEITYDELSQMYISMVFRSLGNSVISIFLPIFLYRLGYPVYIIFAFFSVWYGFMMIGSIVGAFIMARYGPKRTMGFSYVIHSSALLLLATMEHRIAPIWLVAVLFGLANGVFFVAYHVNFSKIKTRKSGGSELGYMTIVEKIGSVAGPMVGGIISTFFAPGYTFLAAILLYVGGLIPLTATGETVRLRQRLKLDKRDLAPFKRDLISAAGINMHSGINSTVWPLFLSIIVFSGGVYMKLGILSTLSTMAMIAIAYTVGKLVDERRGRLLLRSGAVMNAIINLFRPLVASVGGVATVSLGQEVADVATRLPFTKGFYDAADRFESERITYVVMIESVSACSKSFILGLIAIVAWGLPSLTFTVAFMLAAIASLLIMAERFAALKPK